MAYTDKYNLITPDESLEWVWKNIVGNITQDDLDYQRIKEINAADMMQYNTIIYHSESVL